MPAGSTAGSYLRTIAASNQVQPDAIQNFNLVVQAANTAPVVNAGPDQTIAPPANSVQLTGLRHR
jgi:hypothetical protein